MPSTPQGGRERNDAVGEGLRRRQRDEGYLHTGPALPSSTASAGLTGDLPPLPETGIPAALVQRRPDLRQGFYQLQAADQRTAAALADRFPRVNLFGSSDSVADDVDDVFNNWLTNLTGNLVAPIIDGGRRRAEVDRNRALTEQSLSDYRQQLLDALGEVEDALLREQQQRAFIDSLDKQLVLSRQVIGRVRDSYLYGAEFTIIVSSPSSRTVKAACTQQ